MLLVHSAPPQVITPRANTRTTETHAWRDRGDRWLIAAGWALIVLGLLAAGYSLLVIAMSGSTPV